MVEARLPTFAPTDEQAATATELARSLGLGVNDGEAAPATELERSFGLSVDDGSWLELLPVDWAGLCCAYAGTALLPADDRVVEGGGSSCGAGVDATAGLLDTAAVEEVRSAAAPWAPAPGPGSVTPARGGSSWPAVRSSRDPQPITRSRHQPPSQGSRP